MFGTHPTPPLNLFRPTLGWRGEKAAKRQAPFTRPSSLNWMILRMLSLNSLAAFTTEVTRSAGIQPQRGQAAGQAAHSPFTAPGAVQDIAAAQKALPAVPPAPQQALPRGSLLDLRV